MLQSAWFHFEGPSLTTKSSSLRKKHPLFVGFTSQTLAHFSLNKHIMFLLMVVHREWSTWCHQSTGPVWCVDMSGFGSQGWCCSPGRPMALWGRVEMWAMCPLGENKSVVCKSVLGAKHAPEHYATQFPPGGSVSWDHGEFCIRVSHEWESITGVSMEGAGRLKGQRGFT